jgi:hypothetical protein
MHHATSARRIPQRRQAPMTPRGVWHTRHAVFARRDTRVATHPGLTDPNHEAEFDAVVDQRQTALENLLATPAPSLAEVCTKVELLIVELPDTPLQAKALPQVLADLRRLLPG